ncbi:unnamed protein product [Coregonus sp. 'balchen']|nr:unnamed protein product [Coregonus sp. 'balchen']
MVFDPEGERDTSQRPVMEEGRGVEGTLNQNSAALEISDSASEFEEPPRSSPMETEERSFIASLHCFMKDRGTPIERIPHLGFKQINLWKIYKAVEKLGSYDSVTARRLWKNVYDELGGSPGSTSAATCTRRHYERLVLPFERQLRGEEDKPLPPSKPRKQYKRSPEGSMSEGKRKRPHLEKETDSEGQLHSIPSCPWTTPPERLHPDRPPPNNETTVGDDLSSSAYSLSQPGQVISPLEKKKRMAQASLSQSQDCQSPRQEDCKGRPSVIHCSQSPGLDPSSRTRTTSEGSPLPPSSSSSRSPSPYSISSEDCPALTEDRPPVPKPEVPLHFPSKPISAHSGVHKPQSCSPDVKEYVGFPGGQKDFPQVSPLPGDTVSIKAYDKTRGDFGQKPPVHPLFLSTHRLPQSQANPMYRHAPTGHTHASPYEPALYSYPYSIPMWNPHTGYSITGVHYPQTKL